MIYRVFILSFAIVFVLTYNAHAQPVNPNATTVTRAMYQNLMDIQGTDSVIFGQYYATWSGAESSNDIFDMTGKQPGVTEWHIPFMKYNYQEQQAQIQRDFENGILTSFFWRMNNPITDNPVDDITDGNGNPIDISTLIPGGIYHHLYLAQLDKFVAINNDLPKINGDPIPVSFRFLPEMTGGTNRWYKHCTPDQFRLLWISAFNYLTFTKRCNNLFWHFNPNNVSSVTHYKEHYPGHDYVDICGRNVNAQDYLMGSSSMNSMRYAISVAAEENKIVAISQMNSYQSNGDWDKNGIRNDGEPPSIANWWTEVWIDRVQTKDSLLNKIAFSCAWKNKDHLNYFLPFESHEHRDDFVNLCNLPEILLAPDIDLYDTSSVKPPDDLRVTIRVTDSTTEEPVYFTGIDYPGGEKYTSILGEAIFLLQDSGTWNYLIEHPGYFSVTDSVMVTCDTTLEIKLTRKLAEVSLKITDRATGDALPGCLMKFAGQSLVSDTLGTVQLENLQHGTYSLSVSAEYYIPETFAGIEVNSDTSLVFSILPDYPEVTVQVFDRANGEPVSRAVITYSDQQHFTNSSGINSLGGISPGNWVYSIEHTDYFVYTDSAVIINDTSLVIELTSLLADVIFEVSDTAGKLSGVEVTLDQYTLAANAWGIAFFSNKPARKEYIYSIDIDDYKLVMDTFYLEIDTTISVTLESLTGIRQSSMGYVHVYPNPASDMVYVSTQTGEATVNLFSPDGRLLLSEKSFSGTAKLDVSGFFDGCYYLHVQTNRDYAVIRLIISRSRIS